MLAVAEATEEALQVVTELHILEVEEVLLLMEH
jgi:hypothetical protein